MVWRRRKRLREWAREGCKGFSSKALSPAKMYLLRGRCEYLIHGSIDTMKLWINLGADEEGEGRGGQRSIVCDCVWLGARGASGVWA